MRGAHICDHAHGRTNQLGECGNLSGRAHPKFHDGHVVPGGKPQQRQRHADVIVKTRSGFQHAMLRGQHAGGHVLGRGLSVRPCDRHHRKREPPAIPARQLRQCSQGIVHTDEHARKFRVRLCPVRSHHSRERAPLQRIRHKAMPVRMRSFQRKEKRSPFDGSGINGDIHRLPIQILRPMRSSRNACYHRANFLERYVFHYSFSVVRCLLVTDR